MRPGMREVLHAGLTSLLGPYVAELAQFDHMWGEAKVDSWLLQQASIEQPPTHVDAAHNRFWLNETGHFHREGLPAILWADGAWEFWEHGRVNVRGCHDPNYPAVRFPRHQWRVEAMVAGGWLHERHLPITYGTVPRT